MSTSTGRPASSASGTSPVLDRLVEELTNKMEAGCFDYIEKIDAFGGMVEAMPALMREEIRTGIGDHSAATAIEGLKIVVDCGHGAAYKVVPEVLSELGAEVLPTAEACRFLLKRAQRLLTEAKARRHPAEDLGVRQ